MNRSPYLPFCVASLVACLPVSLEAGETQPTPISSESALPDWVPSVRVGYIHQFDADMDDGGSFSVDRFNIRAGVTRVLSRDRMVGLLLGYGHDGFSFDDLGIEPWSDIHTLRMAVPIRWGLGNDWTIFAIPSVRSSAESGASFSDGVTGGLFAGASYKFGDHLTIGPGVGVLSQLEDSVSVFPILLIKWKMTDRLQLETGRGFGSSQGPGLNLIWQASEKWKISLGGQYENMRFRLDDQGEAPDGVGEDHGAPVYLGASYAVSQYSEFSMYIGAKFGGSLILDNSSGKRVSRRDHDTVPFAGITWKYGF